MFSVYDSPPATGGRTPAADGSGGGRHAKAARVAGDDPLPPPPLSPRLSPSAVDLGGDRPAPSSAPGAAHLAPPGSAADGGPPAAAADGAATDARIAALQREVAALRRAAVDGVATSLEEVRSAYGAQLAALERVASAARAEAATLRELVQPAGGGGGGRGGRPATATPVGEPEEAEEVGIEADAGSDDDELPRPTVVVEEVMEEEEVEEVEVLPADSNAAGALAASQAEAASLRRELADARAALAAATATPAPPGAGGDTRSAAASAAGAGAAADGGDAAAALEVLATLVGARPVREPAADADDGGPPVWRLRVANGRTGERARGVDFRLGVPAAISSGHLRARAGRPPAATATTTPRPPEEKSADGEEEEVLLEYDAVDVTVPPGVLPAYVKETAIDMPVEEAPYLFAKIVGAVFTSSAK
ncbi:hypothetical protein I4F81_011834 [Pyropia yezoensis]|uniref:Uncharacterized protein n=1 Tax=Pyropia yezoensis TaxID=2788 RepID=A0ACC3CGQ9_PYRYE|nr:hypothetical protein I4F81_011834 [Neopyropia yezoensis]